MLLPLGPVAVFSAGNFPFAFSVAGGDTASAIAAGCPVVIKVHGGHPATSRLTHSALTSAAADAGLPPEVVQLVYGRDAGPVLVEDPRITAVGFTGSLSGGRALFDLACARPDPIPFYGELGALNALVVCPEAARVRAEDIAEGLYTSFTLSAGQFCTKPGIALLPGTTEGARIRSRLAELVAGAGAQVMLSERIAHSFAKDSGGMRSSSGVRELAAGRPDSEAGGGWWAEPLLLHVDPDSLRGPLLQECFGPVLVVVDYDSPAQLSGLVDLLEPALTASVHAEASDRELASVLTRQLTGKAGRLIWNQYPTGVSVAGAMHHGGPYPATTNPLHTSVGATSIRRWLRPVTYQNYPMELLPAELHGG
jgi:NADP-dependent aldehyde dehydrogenase